MRSWISKGVIAVIVMMAACTEKDTGFGSIDQLSPQARKFLGQKMGPSPITIQATRSVVSGINNSFRGVMQNYAAVSGQVTEEQLDDSVIVQPYPWTTCATLTTIQNEDGSTTQITDYGDGCTEGSGEYQYTMHGKMTSTWRYDQSQVGAVFSYSSFSRSLYENLGGTYTYAGQSYSWQSNGRNSYEGESTYDSIAKTFSGRFASSDTSEYLNSGVPYSNKMKTVGSFTDARAEFTKMDYEYSNADETTSSVVLKTLVLDYSCNSFSGDMYLSSSTSLAPAGMTLAPYYPMYVSGRERIHYKTADGEGEFEVDYGDGTCDSIIIIYENGKAYLIDMAKDYPKLIQG